MKKKIMSALLAACLLLGLVVVRAAAEGNVCVIGGTGYSSLAAAVTDASIGDTIWMTADDAAQQQITIEKSLTIELQGFSLSSTALKISGSGTTVALNDRAGTARINTDRYTGFRATEHRRCDATIYVTGGASLKIQTVKGIRGEIFSRPARKNTTRPLTVWIGGTGQNADCFSIMNMV